MIYGVDISTSVIGLAQFHNDGTYARVDHCDLRDVKGDLTKAGAFREWLVGLTPPGGFYRDDENHVIVEERLGNFAAGRTMLQTLMKLAAFNAVVTYILWCHEDSSGKHRAIIRLHPSTWKSIMKKEGSVNGEKLIIPRGSRDKKDLTLRFVRRVEPDFDESVLGTGLNRNGNPHPWCYDEADAWCLGRSGFLFLKKIKESDPSSSQ
jgi:hypothetical protein